MVNLGVSTDLTIPVKDDTIEVITTYGSAQTLMPATTGETGLNISLEELSNVPVARNIEAVALLAPGTIQGDGSFNAIKDRQLISFGGASVAENVFYIDGLNVTNFRNGLGGSSVPFEFYDQFQIKTGGYGAEFGRSVGGVLNAVTKRGSNDWEYGLVTYSETDLGQGSSPNTIRPDGSFYDYNDKNEQTSFTTDIYVSGPIIKDRLFFYVMAEPQSTNTDFHSLGAADVWNEREVDDDFWGGNLTWNITDNHSLSYTAFSDEREVTTKDYRQSTPAETDKSDLIGTQTDFRGGDNWVARYEGQMTENFSVSAMFGKNEYSLSDTSTNAEVCPYVADVSDTSTSTFPGCNSSNVLQTGFDEREATRIDFEWYVGDHTIRGGFDREENVSVDASIYSGTGFYTPRDGGIRYVYRTGSPGQELANGAILPDYNGDGTDFEYVGVRYIDNGGTFDTIQEAWYLEDTWDINDSFRLTAGIRNERFENNNADGDTFIEITDQWAPRVALEWSPGGTGEQVVSLNYGRYHLPIAANTNVRLSGAELDFTSYYITEGVARTADTVVPVCVGPDGIPTGPTCPEQGTERQTSDGTVPDTSAIVDQNLDPMFQNEWILSYERQISDNLTAGIRYIHRDLSSTIDDILVDQGLELMEARGEFDGPIGSSNDCHYVLTNPGNDSLQNCEWYIVPGDPSGGTELRPTTIPGVDLQFPEAERTYEAFEITVDGTFSALTFQGSYTYSKNEGNTEGLVKSDNGQDDAGITQDFDIPQLMDGAFGYLPNDRRHKVKLWGSYQVSDRLLVGGNFRMQSGRPINAFGIGHPDGTPSYGDTFYLTTDFGDPAVEGDETFAYVPRGTAGRTDWITQVDLSAIYSFDWGDRADVELRAEVFNLFDAESATEVYEFAENRPDQFRLPQRFQRPRYVRIGAAIRFR
jgi:hypothetical protein